MEGGPTPDLVQKPDFNPEPLPPYLDTLYTNLAVTPVFEEKRQPFEQETGDEVLQRESENAAITERNTRLQNEADVMHATRVALTIFEAWSARQKENPFPLEEYTNKENFEKFYTEFKEMSELMVNLQRYMSSFYREGKITEVFSIDKLARKYLSESDLIDEQGNEKIGGAKENVGVEIRSDSELDELRAEKASIIWHDLAQPFTLMNAGLQLHRRGLQMGRTNPERTERTYNAVDSNITNLPEYLDNMNTLIESESFPQEPVHMDRVVGLAEGRFSSRRVTIDDEVKDKVIKTNSLLWFQIVFRNALKNAHEAGANEVKFHASLSEDKKYIEIHIDDNGEGFDDEILEGGFVKGKTTKADKEAGGTGTAMGTCRSFAEKLYPDTTLTPLNIDGHGRVQLRMPIEEEQAA